VKARSANVDSRSFASLRMTKKKQILLRSALSLSKKSRSFAALRMTKGLRSEPALSLSAFSPASSIEN